MSSAAPYDQECRPVGLEHLSLYDVPVSVFIDAAAAGGASSVCLSVNHPEVLDSRLAASALTQLADLNMSVSMGDGFLLNDESGLDGLTRQLDLLVELGGPYANACAFAPDASMVREPARIQSLLGDFCQLAQGAGLGVLIEFTPLSHVPTLAAAVELVAQLDQPNLKIMLDTLHLARAGDGPADVAKVDPALFGYCQISDGPRGSESLAADLDEAIYERAIPGARRAAPGGGARAGAAGRHRQRRGPAAQPRGGRQLSCGTRSTDPAGKPSGAGPSRTIVDRLS